MRILIVCPYPHGQAPSQRFRFEQYLTALQESGNHISIRAFFTQQAWNKLYQSHTILRLWFTFIGFTRRLALFPILHRYNLVFIHREATPIGPPWVEWLIAKVWQKRIIYDFDDAIWLEDPDETGTLLAKLKWKKKVAAICRWSWKVSVGNAYLADFARKTGGAQQVVINPTTIDTECVHNQLKDQEALPLRIGWTGTHSTLQYLRPILPLLEHLQHTYDFEFVVISNQPPDFSLPRLQYIQWNKENEIKDLLRFHIGIMPLTDDAWSQGKCGFKALQYLSLGIPAVVSPIGVNKEIVIPKKSGHWAKSLQEWESSLVYLLNNELLRSQMGIDGRKHVEEFFSVKSNQTNFLLLFQDAPTS